MNNDLENLDRPDSYSETTKSTDNVALKVSEAKKEGTKPFYKNPYIIGGGIVAFILILITSGLAVTPKNANKTNVNDNQPVNMVPSFGGAQETQEIETQLQQSSNNNLKQQQTQIKTLQGQVSDLKDQNSQEVQGLKAQLEQMQQAMQKKQVNVSNKAQINQNKWLGPHPANEISGGGNESTLQSGSNNDTSKTGLNYQINNAPMVDFKLNYTSDDASSGTEYNHYVPAGTFVQAVLLGGADANAAVGSQGNTTPILFRLLDNGTEPNLKKAQLKNCVVTGQTYGDISSDRAIVRLDRLSCNYPDGTILDIPVYGTAYDIGGKNGVRGNEVLHNGKILAMSGVSGFLQGFANAFQNMQTTQTANLIGTTSTTVSPSSSVSYAAYGGAASAMNNLSSYYIQLAEQYHPIIQINAGAKVDLIFTKGFSTDPTQTNLKPSTKTGEASQTNPYGFASAPQTQSWQVPVTSTNSLTDSSAASSALKNLNQQKNIGA